MYAELKCRTHYSFLRGASHPHELIDRAAELGLRALAITDRDGVYGMPKAYAASKAHPNLKLIVGAELTLQTLPRLTLLATDRASYGQLCRMLTASHKTKDHCALSWREFTAFKHQGLFCLPEIPTFRQDIEFLGMLRDLFPGRLRLPLTRHLDGLDRSRTDDIRWLSRELQVPIIATNDVHYHVPARRMLQDVLTCTRELTDIAHAGHKLFSNAERYLRSPEETLKLFKDMPEALANTLEVAEACTFSPAELRYRYPSEWIPKGQTAQSYLTKLVYEGADWRYGKVIPIDVLKQLEHELKLVEELQFADYFLTIWEIVEFARGRRILCQGRGSAANSAICYVLGITAIDPVRMNLLFERFLSAERGEPPDIDVDFEHERREEVIQHIYEKYGRDRAGMVAAVITYRSRSALRDVSKALGTTDSFIQPLVEELKEFPRHLSIHSGGFTLSADPIIETVPVEPARMEGRTIVQWDKNDLAIIGLLKVDVLALGMLSALRKTFDLVPGNLTIATIPPEDPKTYAMIQKADTVGTFQIESRAQMNMLARLKPENFYDLVVQVAIVRPGPIVGQMVHPYLRRRRGQEPVTVPHLKLKPILDRTLGVPLFQEQVMKIAIELAGFSPGEADELRRAVNAWKSNGSIEKMGARLKQGLLASGLPQDWVEKLFEMIKGFAHYGFPESHAASFALIAYASAYVRAHYPAEFAAALLNSQPMGFYAPHTIVEDARRHGVEVYPVNPNISEWDCVLERKGVRIGLRAVQGIVKDEAEKLISARPFRSLEDFLRRTRLGPRVLYRMALADAFAEFGITQRSALWKILACQPLMKPEGEQLLLEFEAPRAGVRFRELNDYQKIEAQYAAYGLSTEGHPLRALREGGGLPRLTTQSVKQVKGTASVAGLIIARQRPSTAKGAVFATLEDEHGFADLIFHGDSYEKFEEVMNTCPFVIVSGRTQTDGHAFNLIVQKVERMDAALAEFRGVHSHDFH